MRGSRSLRGINPESSMLLRIRKLTRRNLSTVHGIDYDGRRLMTREMGTDLYRYCSAPLPRLSPHLARTLPLPPLDILFAFTQSAKQRPLRWYTCVSGDCFSLERVAWRQSSGVRKQTFRRRE